MNKIAIALSAALAVGAATSAYAQSGTVTFNGEITAQTCSVDFSGGAVGTGGNATVDLGKVSVGAMAAAGSRGGKKPITLTVGAGSSTCGPLTSFRVELNPSRTAQLEGAGYLQNIATATPANNVAVVLSDDKGTDINLGSSWASDFAAIGQPIVFSGEMISAAGSAQAGNVQAVVEYTLNYN